MAIYLIPSEAVRSHAWSIIREYYINSKLRIPETMASAVIVWRPH